MHFLRNALDYVPRKVDDDYLQELSRFYDRRDLTKVRRDIAQWLAKWQAKYPRLCNWVAKARRRALFLDQEGRVDRARRILEGDHQIVLPSIARQPGEARAS